MVAGEPTLYSFRRCPYAMRARMALLISGVPFAIREVALRAKPAALIAASAKGTVPVLVLLDGRVIDESVEIMRRALERSDPEKWLAGEDGALVAAYDDRFKHHLDRYKYADRHGADAAVHRDAGLAMLKGLEARLAAADNLCRDRRAFADIAIMPFVRQFAAVDDAWFAVQPVPGVRAWLARHVASGLFARAMVRLPPWVPADTVVRWQGTSALRHTGRAQRG